MLTLSLYLSEPYKVISNSNSSFKFLKERSVLKQAVIKFLSIYCKKRATQEKVVSCFNFGTTVTHSVQSIFKIMTKFMFI